MISCYLLILFCYRRFVRNAVSLRKAQGEAPGTEVVKAGSELNRERTSSPWCPAEPELFCVSPKKAKARDTIWRSTRALAAVLACGATGRAPFMPATHGIVQCDAGHGLRCVRRGRSGFTAAGVAVIRFASAWGAIADTSIAGPVRPRRERRAGDALRPVINARLAVRAVMRLVKEPIDLVVY